MRKMITYVRRACWLITHGYTPLARVYGYDPESERWRRMPFRGWSDVERIDDLDKFDQLLDN